MSNSDAPTPPGGPQRQDAAEGDFVPGGERDDLPTGGSDGSAADDSERKHPSVTHEPEQSAEESQRQEENAETTEDQPSQ